MPHPNGQSTQREGGCPLRKKEHLYNFFFFLFVAVLLTTKPREGGTKCLSGLSTKKDKYFVASLS